MPLRIYGNRLLKTVPGSTTRPTLGKVREAVFNIWQGRIDGCRWLDLCAGNGTMGAEALGRGASRAIAIEQSIRACKIIQDNWQTIAQPHQTIQVMAGNVLKRLPQLVGQQFDYIYLDPPYASNIYEPALEAIAHLQLLAPYGELAVEHDPQRKLANVVPASSDPPRDRHINRSLTVCRQKVYGGTALTFFRCSDF